MKERKPYPISNIVKWYYGNYCTRKCFNNTERLSECWERLLDFAYKNRSLKISHKEFKDLFDNDDIKICKLKPKFRRRTIFFKEFERLSKDHYFDPDKFD